MTNYDRLFKIIKYLQAFEYNFHRNKEHIFFYRADWKESTSDIEGCREIYQYLEQQGVFEAYIRHIYMELRNNQIQNAVKVFTTLAENVKDGDQIVFVVQELGDILNKVNYEYSMVMCSLERLIGLMR
mgnify:CR=1 FL=1